MLSLDIALQYIKNGWSVIPVHSIINRCCTCRKDDCDKPGKHPLINWKPYQKRLPTEEEIRKWWTKWPWANIAIVTGRINGVFVMDVDGPEGMKSIKGYEIPETVVTKTGGGGYHYYFRYPYSE